MVKKGKVPKTRKFGGKTYGTTGGVFFHSKKSYAKRSADHWRRKDYLARVVPMQGGWVVYRRKKR